jgi:ABC-type uncharacterized transport system substrate-binding protein
MSAVRSLSGVNRTPPKSAQSVEIDPTETLAGLNRLAVETGFQPLSKCWFEPLRCRLLNLGPDMQRRAFITLLGGTAAAWPFSARAQQPAMPVVGFLGAGSAESDAFRAAAVQKGLIEAGYVEGRNVAFASLNRPSGNLTGVAVLNTAVMGKRLELLHELVPAAETIALLSNPNSSITGAETKELHDAARVLGVELRVLNAVNEDEIDAAFGILGKERSMPLVVSTDNLFTDRPAALATLAARHSIVAIYPYQRFADEGGLMSFGPDLAEGYRQVGTYVGRILKGAQPTDLPVEQVVKLDLVLNLNTAKALGISFPLSLLDRADKVIE